MVNAVVGAGFTSPFWEEANYVDKPAERAMPIPSGHDMTQRNRVSLKHPRFETTDLPRNPVSHLECDLDHLLLVTKIAFT
ncbi:MAG TPA: hypothetical protein DDW76_08800 [Cyanobacteria bacterium UBA11369]|nr:hypothetical protein [Cyanobacteria bacterium UBA11371]HBE34309.1 hypothetical protein [Cyanobacteria bacterium UBA11368]HBE48879.1 hypothetical protein [Cyanobacteria bacterium UBA11369]